LELRSRQPQYNTSWATTHSTHFQQLDKADEGIIAATNNTNFQLPQSKRHVCIDTDPWDPAYEDSNEHTPTHPMYDKDDKLIDWF